MLGKDQTRGTELVMNIFGLFFTTTTIMKRFTKCTAIIHRLLVWKMEIKRSIDDRRMTLHG